MINTIHNIRDAIAVKISFALMVVELVGIAYLAIVFQHMK